MMIGLAMLFGVVGLALIASAGRKKSPVDLRLRHEAVAALTRIRAGGDSREDYETVARFFGSIGMPDTQARFLEYARDAGSYA
jgi:hypothetical protein